MVPRSGNDGQGSPFLYVWKELYQRFKDTDLFEQIFSRILQECYKYRLIDPSEVSTYVKARANSKKMRKRIADEEALFFEEQLKKEINEDREAHGKKPLKEKKEDPRDPPLLWWQL